MNFLRCRIRRETACCLVIFLALPVANALPLQPQQKVSRQRSSSVTSLQSQTASADIPDENAISEASTPEVVYPDEPTPVHTQTSDQNGLPNALPPEPRPAQQSTVQTPVGTAAAPYEKIIGITASRPAGAVVAPAKQRRAWSILIRVGVVVGAVVAIGTVALLSRASPSRPN